MLRILHVIGSMNAGGAETMLMNFYRHIDRTKIQFDFVVHTDRPCFYDSEIDQLGGRIFRAKRFCVSNYFSYKKWWISFLNQHPEYTIIHGHINSSAAIYLSIAKRKGLYTIVHSHATKNREKGIRSIAFRIFSYPTRYIADYFFACSKQAGLDRFGARIVSSSRFQVLLNGIELEKFVFDTKMRVNVRGELKTADNVLVFGHVGRFTYAKNHKFLLEVFHEIHKKQPKTELWLVGDGGELKAQVEEWIQVKKLSEAVKQIGVTNSVEYYLQGMDVFLFPSVFEGLSLALIEAQATSLPCLISETLPSEVDIHAGLIHRFSLYESAESWAETALNLEKFSRTDQREALQQAGFDAVLVASELQGFYLKHAAEGKLSK